MTDWIAWAVEQAGYAGIAFLMFLETVIPPIPSEVIMSLAGVAAARGSVDLTGVIVAGTAGAMAGNWLWYWLARRYGVSGLARLRKRGGRFAGFSTAAVDRGTSLFARGPWIVGVGRMLPNMRSLISVPAGLCGMGHARFLIYSTIGTAGWTALLAMAGYGATDLRAIGRDFFLP